MRWVRCVVLVLAQSAASAADPMEEWSDRQAKLPGGLAVWLDAGRQPNAWQSHGRQPLYHSAKLDVWYDGSGHRRHFMQRVREAQPEFVQVGNRAAVRFDGTDDFLEFLSPGWSIEQFTAVLVVAPRSNPGSFRAFFAAHEAGKNDYLTGFNLDMSAEPSDRFQQLNAEGLGFGGAVNLMKGSSPFGEFRVIAVISEAGDRGVRVTVDGQVAGHRRRNPGRLRLDAVSLAARCYSNSPEPPAIAGFLDGYIAELLLFDRALDNSELQSVNDYLTNKHAGLTQAIENADRHGGRLPKTIDNPPLVQMLPPGFIVDELPVELTNINNVRYRHDGRLYAVAYDGNIYLLSDTDNDGMEDRASIFWKNNGQLRGPIGIALTPPNYPHGSGLFVASKGKVSLIVDTDGDDEADREMVVASGWTEIPQNVDAIGVALAPDGSLYFGLGTANYANAYLIDGQGQSHFDLSAERGTVLRVAPDFSRREVVCTGVRFPVSLAFNRHGDLFATDQEGATWLPNGNPFDELLHIQPGRHYGFPPRHPRHLPNVVDEPSVFDYRPQHQSTCGMFFNESLNGGPAFGPSFWSGDAIVCGESRGKLFRTQLVKTRTGYVAANQTIACLNMLTVDACLSPQGDLVVACHSGPPDWGTGPQGKGKLFRIRYSQTDVAQPVFAWLSGPQELRVEFDRPVDPAELKDLARGTNIEYGRFVGAGDQYEALKPPYSIVQQQQMTPRFPLPIHSAQMTADRRTLIFASGRHQESTQYSLSLPGVGRGAGNGAGGIRQVAAIDLSYDLSGVMAEWQPEPKPGPGAAGADDAESWSGWLPHPNLAVAREFTQGSASHERLWRLLSNRGKLTLHWQLDLWNMLRPAIQPGGSIDWNPPAEIVTVLFHAQSPFHLIAAGHSLPCQRADDHFIARLEVTPIENQPMDVQLTVKTGETPLEIDATWFTAENDIERPLPLRRFLLPWVKTTESAADLAVHAIPELEGGDWLRGRTAFLSEQLACVKCHTVRGLAGGRIGPDLSNLSHRDYRSVLRDLLEPNATINPDHVSYTVALKDGRVLAGVPVSTDAKRVMIGDQSGRLVEIGREEIDELKVSNVSGMPADIANKLDARATRDLMTFLMTEPIQPARLERRDAPPARRRLEVESVARSIAGVPAAASKDRRLHVALVAGPKDHGPDEHDYPLWQTRWAQLLALAPEVEVSQATGWPSTEQLEQADVIVFYSSNPAWTEQRAADLDSVLERGGGLVYIHFAVNGGKHVKALAERIGLAADIGNTKYRHGPLDLHFPDVNHPITRGFDRLDAKVHFVDESYWDMTGDVKRIHVLATAEEEGKQRPLLWSLERGRGRVFVSILGHYSWTFDDPLFRLLLLRGIAWAGSERADRLSELIAIGSRVEP